MSPRRAALVGLLFIAIGVIYYLFPTAIDPKHVDFAGLTLLLALGVAMSLMAYVLFAGTRRS